MSEASSIPSWAKVGAKVVCVGHPSGNTAVAPRGIVCPVVGSVYTIRRVSTDGIRVGVYLREIVNKPEQDRGEPGFLIRGFRPVIEPKTEAEDLATFRKWLRVDQPQGVDA